jgi:hypothetical protein
MSKETLRRSRRTRSPREKCRSLPKMVPLPGTLRAEHKACGRPNCRCARGELHGPYLYRRWREHGRQRRQYVKPADAERVRAGIAAWRRLHPPARSARDTIRELRRPTGAFRQPPQEPDLMPERQQLQVPRGCWTGAQEGGIG